MEIERKYLCGPLPFSLEPFCMKAIAQAYISTDPTIRIRKYGDEFILTVKGAGDTAREEFELSLSKKQYETLSKKIETPFVEKNRYMIPISKGLIAELDIYTGNLEGLLTVEVEFDTINLANEFVAPHWFGLEVSNDHRYKNTNLSIYGIPKDYLL